MGFYGYILVNVLHVSCKMVPGPIVRYLRRNQLPIINRCESFENLRPDPGGRLYEETQRSAKTKKSFQSPPLIVF